MAVMPLRDPVLIATKSDFQTFSYMQMTVSGLRDVDILASGCIWLAVPHLSRTV